MPIYVYEPTVHSVDEPVSECCFFETLQGVSEAVLLACPHCGHTIHRALTTFGISKIHPPKASPGKSVEERLRDGFQGLSDLDASLSDHENSASWREKKEPTSASGRAARLAARHICSAFCKH